MNKSNAVTASDIMKRFYERTILDGISFELAEEEFLVIVGPSGCGKTTLLRIVAGLDLPDAGEISIRGQKATAIPGGILVPPFRRGLGYVFQEPALWPNMTVEANIAFGIRGVKRIEAEARAVELMERMEIPHLRGAYPDRISGGEARRVSLARALAPRPACILMDEPLTNLDARIKDLLLDYALKHIRETKAALIYVTHDAGEAERVSARRLVLG